MPVMETTTYKKGEKVKLTKKDMARIILQALWNTKKLPKDEGIWKRRINKIIRHKKENLESIYKLSIKVLQDRINKEPIKPYHKGV